MKVVINNCYGGFGLSPLAIQEYAKRKGKECYLFLHQYKRDKNGWPKGESELAPCTLEEATGATMFSAYTVPNPEEYGLGERGADGTFKEANARSREISIYCRDIPRDDADLVAVVEELGEKASGNCAKLKVVEVPDGTPWEIQEYDGNEWVAETHRTWS